MPAPKSGAFPLLLYSVLLSWALWAPTIHVAGQLIIPWGPPPEEYYINGQLTTSPFAFQPGTTLSGAQQCLLPSESTGRVVTTPCLTPVSADSGALIDKWTYNFTDYSVRTWYTPDRQPTGLCLDGGSVLDSIPSNKAVSVTPCNSSAPAQNWVWDDAYLKISDYNWWLSAALDTSSGFQLSANKSAAASLNFVLPPYTQIDTYALQPGLAHPIPTSDANPTDISDIGDGPGPCAYGVHRAGYFYTSLDCAAQCNQEPKCLGFTFGSSQGVGCCYLKAFFPPAQSTGHSGYSTYFRGTSAVPGFPSLNPPSTQEAANAFVRSGTSHSSSNIVPIIVGVLAGAAVLALVVALVVGCWLCKKRKRKRGRLDEVERTKDVGDKYCGPPRALVPPPEQPETGLAEIGDALSPFWRAYSYKEISVATRDFASENLLGEGAFGRVYRGFLPDKSPCAIKQLKAGPKGFKRREFLGELRALSQVRHRNLVALRGYCVDGNGQYFLILDLADGGNLNDALHEGARVLDWETRVRIAIAAARGLAYLHNDTDPPIIHRDIKSANILLDSKNVAQVADFGVARLMEEGDEEMTMQARGTYGYVAPEYIQEGLLTKKLDVYSFGVVLLELLTGMRALCQTPEGRRSLVHLAGTNYPGVDPRLQDQYVPEQATYLYEIARACFLHYNSRPDMRSILRALQNLEDVSGSLPRSLMASPGPVSSVSSDASHSNLSSGQWAGESHYSRSTATTNGGMTRLAHGR